jgi:hypothetical protein
MTPIIDISSLKSLTGNTLLHVAQLCTLINALFFASTFNLVLYLVTLHRIRLYG